MRAQAALWGWLGSRGCLGNTGGDGAPPLRDGTGYVDEGAGNGARAGAEAGPYAWGRWFAVLRETAMPAGRPLRMGAVVVNKVCL